MKRSANSTVTSVSEVDSSLNTSENEIKENKQQKESKKQKKSKQKAKKVKTMADSVFVESSIENKLQEINSKLSNVLTKNDRGFIRDIVKETISEIQEQLLGSVIKRLELLESEIHEKSIENISLQKKIKTQMEANEYLQHENLALKNDLKQNNVKLNESLNDLEQYGRRNNVRITGLGGDGDKQSSSSTTNSVVKTLNEHLKMDLNSNMIDISHRVGKYSTNKQRSVIVKFVHRQTKINLMKLAKNLKGTGIYINEDLTHANQEVLSAMRRNAKDKIEHCWSFEGRLYARIFGTNKKLYTEQIMYKDYGYWMAYRQPTR